MTQSDDEERRERARERLVMDYPVELDRLPDAMLEEMARKGESPPPPEQ